VCLSNVLTRCPQHQLKLWLNQKELFMKSTQLIKCFGKPALTSAQAKKLVSKNLLLDDLKIIQREVGSEAEFHRSLKTKGINSQPLREKLWKALKRLTSSDSLFSSSSAYYSGPSPYKINFLFYCLLYQPAIFGAHQIAADFTSSVCRSWVGRSQYIKLKY